MPAVAAEPQGDVCGGDGASRSSGKVLCELRSKAVEPRVDQPDVVRRRDQPAALADEQVAMLEVGGHRPPVLAMLRAGGRHPIDRRDALGMKELTRDSQALAQVDGADEQQVDSIDG